ncbi:PREDICTED: uncharacterized protein LOC103329135 [Prunus mume]|uniref:Uncharacterized protein LOC103329135 n=1 Tax=Prunus mume TaxID=102107 RepID=A0ABM0NTY5_PRUMU|nr:PREDICTED: uncharacterized protein LOC103329135 [Prunus mume]
MTVAAYYTKIKGLWDELGSYNDTVCSCGADHKRRQLMQFLMGLNEPYKAIRGQILLMNPLPDVRQAYSSIVQEEKQRSLGDARETTETAAMAVRRDEPVALAVRPGQGSSSRSNSSNRKPLHCSYCDKDHHVRDTCWKLHGYPPGHPKHKSNRSNHGGNRSQFDSSDNSAQSSINHVKEGPTMQEMQSVMNGLSDLQYQQILSIMNNKGGNQSSNPKANVAGTSSSLSQAPLHLHRLILDSGATDHITSSPNLLVNCRQNTDLTTKTTIGLGKQRGRLYYLVALASTTPSPKFRSSAAFASHPSCSHVTSSTDLWHRRLGHLSSSRLDFMAKNLLNFPFKSNNACDTPFERLYGKAPSYSHLKVFGCLAYATDVHVPHKFAPRAKCCVFLGYPVGQKAYKLYDLTTHKFFTSRDIVFHENIFPYASPQSIPTPPAPVIPHFMSDLPISDSFPTTSTAPLEPVHPVTPFDMAQPDSPFASLDPATSTYDQPIPASVVQPPSIPVLRCSQRHHSPPRALRDYVCNQVTSPKPSLPSSFGSTKEAASHSHWKDAMQFELAALKANHTWSLTPLPHGKKPIGCRWVYKIKRHSDGIIERYKAHLVAKGYTQLEGIDYHDTFSPITKMITVRCLLAMAAAQDWSLHQLDVNNAFLHGDLHEEIYMSPPPGLQ